jgi:1-acyl-sn-glycerol-3-phosphate acyltransferase
VVEQGGGVAQTASYRPSRLRAVVSAFVLGISSVLFAILATLTLVVSRRLSVAMARTWARLWLWTDGVRLQVTWADRLKRDQRYVFVSNHQSAIDIPLLYAALPHQISFISKKELFFLPVFGWAMAAVGHIYIDRANPRKAHGSIVRAAQTLKRRRGSLVIFPEGTRSADGSLGDFKTGSFRVAIEAGVELVPIAIRNSCRVRPKKSLVPHPGPVQVVIGEPIAVSGYAKTEKAQLAATVRGIVAGMLAEAS